MITGRFLATMWIAHISLQLALCGIFIKWVF